MTFLKNVHPLDNSRDLVIHSMTNDQETKIQGIQGIMEHDRTPAISPPRSKKGA